jgi:hypothetical protein
MKPKIYVAGPYTKGDVTLNVREAFRIGTILVGKGFAPYIPHSTHFWNLIFPQTYNFWQELDDEYLSICDGIFRIKGDSKGADHEIEYAIKKGIPQFYTLEDLYLHFKI